MQATDSELLLEEQRSTGSANTMYIGIQTDALPTAGTNISSFTAVAQQDCFMESNVNESSEHTPTSVTIPHVTSDITTSLQMDQAIASDRVTLIDILKADELNPPMKTESFEPKFHQLTGTDTFTHNLRRTKEMTGSECKDDKCLFSFNQLGLKRIHSHLKKEHGRYNCNLCAASFPKLILLLQHENAHRENSRTKTSPSKNKQQLKKFCCDQCPMKFRTEQEFIDHIKYHQNKGTFQCYKYKAKYPNKALLKRNRQTQLNNTSQSVNDLKPVQQKNTETWHKRHNFSLLSSDFPDTIVETTPTTAHQKIAMTTSFFTETQPKDSACQTIDQRSDSCSKKSTDVITDLNEPTNVDASVTQLLEEHDSPVADPLCNTPTSVAVPVSQSNCSGSSPTEDPTASYSRTMPSIDQDCFIRTAVDLDPSSHQLKSTYVPVIAAPEQDGIVMKNSYDQRLSHGIPLKPKRRKSRSCATKARIKKCYYKNVSGNVCSASFKKRPQLFRHQNKVHGIKEKYMYWCEECPQKFRRETELIRHNLDHLDKDAFRCDQCTTSYPTKSLLKWHQKFHFKQTSEVKLTMQERQSPKSPRYHHSLKCTHCPKEFQQIYQFEEHLFLIHDITHPYQCSDCPKTFRQIYGLKSHQIIHKRNEKYKCSYCSASFSVSGPLNVHLQLHLTKEDQTSDPIANRKTTSISPHAEKIDGRGPHCSDTTNVVSSQPAGINIFAQQIEEERDQTHISSHDTQPTALDNSPVVKNSNQTSSSAGAEIKLELSDDFIAPTQAVRSQSFTGGCKKKPDCEKPYTCYCCVDRHKCHRCFVGFARNYELHHHIKLAHAEEVSFPYSCLECPAKYKMPASFVRHQRVHSANEKYKCHLCTASYNYHLKLYQHLKTHHHADGNSNELKLTANLAEHQSTNYTASPHQPTGISTSAMPTQVLPASGYTAETFPVSSTRYQIKENSNDSNSDVVPYYECSSCHSRFTTETAYLMHARIHCQEQEQSSNDNTQNDLYYMASQDKLEDGFKPDGFSAPISKDNRFVCLECPAEFRILSLFRDHQTAHHKKAQFKCPHCTASFHSKLSRARHRILHATGEQYEVSRPRGKFACHECPAHYNEKAVLLKHLLCHIGDKEFQCELCTASFAKYTFLQAHKRHHEDWVETHGIVFKNSPAHSANKKWLVQQDDETETSGDQTRPELSACAPLFTIEVKAEPDSSEYERCEVTSQMVTMSTEVMKAPE